MRYRLISPLLLSLLAQLVPTLAHAELDEVQLRLQKQLIVPLRWDNVESAPEQAGGEDPDYQRKAGMHLVKLMPSQSTVVRVPRGSRLRIYSPVKKLTLSDLHVDVSNGSGVYAALPLAISTDGHSLLTQPDPDTSTLVRVTRPAEKSDSIEVGLFNSRMETPPEIAPYRGLVPLASDTVQMRRSDDAAPQKYWRFKPGQDESITITGPARFVFEHRLAYPANEAGLIQFYRILVKLDGAAFQVMEFETSAEQAYPVYVDRRERVMGRLQKGYLEIPSGEHTLLLNASAQLYGRILRQEQPDYLFPQLNQPVVTAEEVRRTLPLNQLKMSYWLKSQEAIRQDATDPTIALTNKEMTSLRLARDNSHREGGMLAAVVMQDAANRNPDFPPAQTLASDLLGFHTFYRDVLPNRKHDDLPQRFQWFVTRRLHNLGEQGRGIAVGEQHARQLMDRLGSAYFVSLPFHQPDLSLQLSETSEGKIKVSLPSDVLFDTDKHAIKPAFHRDLLTLVRMIQSQAQGDIQIIGHTDSNASYHYNQLLSERRASSVAKFLSLNGVDSSRLRISGKGKTEPRATNATVSGRQLNRRVEVVFARRMADPAISRSVCMEMNCYDLPQRAGQSWVRVIADLETVTQETEFLVQYDEQPPIPIRVLPSGELPESEYAPSQGEAGLEMLRLNSGRFGNAATLSGPFSREHVPAIMVRAGVFDLTLPPNVRQLRLWRSEKSTDQLRVALQYRTSKPAGLTESEYLELTRRMDASGDIYSAFMQAYNKTASPDLDTREVQNHWLPLLRYLKVQHKGFSLNVAPPLGRAGGPISLSDKQISSLRSQALKAQSQSQWIIALENWAKIIQGSAGKQRREAQLSRVYALQQAGEDYLAEQQLRGMLLFGDDETLKQTARTKLVEYYRKGGDEDGLLVMLAAVADIDPSKENMRALSESFMTGNEYELALMTALVAQDNTMGSEVMLRASYQLGWWEVFEATLARVPDEKKRAFWHAQRQINSSNYAEAMRHFELAGEEGKPWLHALQNGMQIHDALSSKPESIGEQRHAWETWQASHPGEYGWKEAADLVTDYAGTIALYSIERDVYANTFQATPQKPLKLNLVGPLRLRLDARPLHAGSQEKPIDGWLEIRESGQLRLLPYSNNVPAEGLSLIGQPLMAAGRKVSSEFEFGPGLHEVALSSKQASMLLRVFAYRPEMPLGILPPLSVETMGAFNMAELTPAKQQVVHCVCRDCLTLVPGENLTEVRTTHLRDQFKGPWLSETGSLSLNTDFREKATKQEIAAEVASTENESAEHNAVAWPEAAHLAKGEIEAALAGYTGKRDEEVIRRMLLLLWLADQDPKQRDRALVLGEALASSRPDLPQLQPLLARLSRNAGWLPVNNVQSSAGLRFIEVNGWQPESPALRVRRTLLSPLNVDDQVISGTGRMVLTMTNLSPAVLQAEMTAEDVEYMVPQALSAQYQIDDLIPVIVKLSPQQLHKSIPIRIPAGKHALRISILNPVSNQFLRIRLLEKGASSLSRSVELPYEVSTRKEPLVVGISGPAWLKVDELRESNIRTHYRLVEPGWQKLTFAPERGKEEALYRISQRMMLPGERDVPARKIPLHPEPVPGPMVNLAYVPPAKKVMLQDGFDLGGQEDGTWSLTGSFNNRRDVIENTGGAGLERFLEVDLTHRYYDENRRSYFKTEMLGRTRQNGGPTLGVRELIDFRPIWAPVTFKLEGSFYAQNPGLMNGSDTQWRTLDSALWDGGLKSVEWAALLRGSISQKRDIDPKTWHLPEIALFQRKMSLNDAQGYDGKNLDQDVFTQYKADHRHGLSLGDTLIHRPWLDTLWHANLSTHSNKDWNVFKPDHITLGVGWKQLMGEFEVNLDYQMNRLFADENRMGAFNRKSIILDVNWQHWRVNQQRFEVGLKLRRDIETSAGSGMLYFSWHFGHGSMYKDFRPGEVDFLDIRQRRIPQEMNNSIKDMDESN